MRIFVFLFAFILLFIAQANATEPKLLGKFKDWEAYSYEEPNGRVCYALTRPLPQDKKAKKIAVKRGQVMLQVSHRPAEGSRNTVSYVAGTSLKDDSDVILQNDKKQRFTLTASGDSGWSKSPDIDNQIVQGMRAGNIMSVSSDTKKAHLSDVFSLKGSSAALTKIDEACGY